MLNKEQAKDVRKQLIEQINSTFPEDKKAPAISQIKSMNNEQLEQFLQQNNLTDQPKDQKCVFCSIIFGDLSSHKIAENEKAVAVLEINPISKGHSIIIPKEHLASRKEFPDEVLLLADKIKARIQKKLKPKEVEVSTQNLFGHEIMNLLPVYNNEDINSERKKADEKELQELQTLLSEKEEKTLEGPKIKQINADDIWLPKRIP